MDRIVEVAWYCSECGRTIPVADERIEDRDRRAHLERHRQRKGVPDLGGP
jgi:hypothetical protein